MGLMFISGFSCVSRLSRLRVQDRVIQPACVEGFDLVSQVLGFVGGPRAVGREVEFGVWGLRIQVCGGRGEESNIS